MADSKEKHEAKMYDSLSMSVYALSKDNRILEGKMQS
jgi:hypothetical protein